MFPAWSPYAKLGRMRIYPRRRSLRRGENRAEDLDTTCADKTFLELREMVHSGSVNLFHEFGAACRAEFETAARKTVLTSRGESAHRIQIMVHRHPASDRRRSCGLDCVWCSVEPAPSRTPNAGRSESAAHTSRRRYVLRRARHTNVDSETPGPWRRRAQRRDDGAEYASGLITSSEITSGDIFLTCRPGCI